MGTKTAVTGGV